MPRNKESKLRLTTTRKTKQNNQLSSRIKLHQIIIQILQSPGGPIRRKIPSNTISSPPNIRTSGLRLLLLGRLHLWIMLYYPMIQILPGDTIPSTPTSPMRSTTIIRTNLTISINPTTSGTTITENLFSTTRIVLESDSISFHKISS